MFLRGLWHASLNEDLIETSQRHLMPARAVNKPWKWQSRKKTQILLWKIIEGLGLGFGLGFFYFILNSPLLIRDATCSRSYLNEKKPERQCHMNTLAVKKKMRICFNIKATRTKWIQSILNTMFEFMLILLHYCAMLLLMLLLMLTQMFLKQRIYFCILLFFISVFFHIVL